MAHPPLIARIVARTRLPAVALCLASLVVAGSLLALKREVSASRVARGLATVLLSAGVSSAAYASLVIFVAPVAGGGALVTGSPVRGRWEALNSPASRVPSHGMHAYGQTYALDLRHRPEGSDLPLFGGGQGHLLAPERFPAFGQPVFAPADAVVVAAHGGELDHRSRSSWAALALFVIESMPRELRGLRGVLGNHVVLRLSDGSHFLLAHLRHGSLRVRVGESVQRGQQVAECGNTGNSTEPHLHCQRQDVASTLVALGLPWAIEGALPGGGDGLPKNGTTFEGRD